MKRRSSGFILPAVLIIMLAVLIVSAGITGGIHMMLYMTARQTQDLERLLILQNEIEFIKYYYTEIGVPSGGDKIFILNQREYHIHIDKGEWSHEVPMYSYTVRVIREEGSSDATIWLPKK